MSFAMHNAARLYAVRAIRAAGFRVKQQGGGHYNTFLALEVALGASSSDLVVYLDACRERRNVLVYDIGHAVSDTEADELVHEVEKLRHQVDRWLRTHYPDLT